MIVKAFAEGFESQSRNGLATVVVQNTGFVTADFYVSKIVNTRLRQLPWLWSTNMCLRH